MATKLPIETYIPIWEAAATEEIGMLVRVHPDDTPMFINELYECRKTFGGYEDLIIMQPMPPGTLYIMHKTVELPE